MVENKVFIVTGAGSGIGLTTAHTLAAAGAKVIAADLNAASATSTADAIRKNGGDAQACVVDIQDETSVMDMVRLAVKHYGRLDGAHNNAGVEMSNKPVHELTADDWHRVINVDLTGTFYCLKHEFLAMKDSGGGTIVNTASDAGVRGLGSAGDYVAAKHGVVGLTKTAAIDGAPLKIRVNSVCPGFVLTPMAEERLMEDPVFKAGLDVMLQRHVIGRFGQPQEIANAVVWLLSDASSFVTGSAMLVDGGYAI